MGYNVPNLRQSLANKVHRYYNDFDKYAAGDWTITEVGSGSRALENMDGGSLLITNAAADNDGNFFQAKEAWLFDSTKSMMFRSRFKISDATQSDFTFGLQITDTTPLAVSNGIWFQKDDGDANLDFHVAAASVQSDLIAFDTLANATWVELAFSFKGGGTKIEVYRDGVSKGSLPITNAPTAQTLAVSFGVQNGEAVAKNMSIDYIEVIKER